MKQGLSRNNNMKPGRLIWMTNNIILQVPEIPAGLVEKCVPVPRRSAEIPEVRDYKKQDPKEKECCFWICQRLETASQFPRACRKSSKQKEHAEQPPDRLPWVSPTRFTIMRGAGKNTNQQVTSDKPSKSNRRAGTRRRF